MSAGRKGRGRTEKIHHAGADLTQGPVAPTLLRFSLPFLLSNLLQALYGVVDMLVIGWFSDAAGIAAVSTGTQVAWLANCLGIGIAMGGTILIGQFVGAGRRDEVTETIGTMLSMFLAIGVAVTALMLTLNGSLLRWLNTPPEAFEQTRGFVAVSSLGTVFLFGFNAIGAIFRGLGDSKSPLVFVGISCAANVVLELLFVGVFGWNAPGAAAATALAQVVGLAVALYWLSIRTGVFRFSRRSLSISREKAGLLLRTGLPLSVQDLAVNISFLFITSIINALGLVPAAAVGIASRFDSFAMLPAMALSMAVAGMTAQNIGAKAHERAYRVWATGTLVSAGFGLLMLVLAQIEPRIVLIPFTRDEAIIAAGIPYVRSFSFDFLMVGFVFCMSGFFNGCGHTRFSLLNNLLTTLLFRVPFAWALTHLVPWGLAGVGLAAPIASLMAALVGAVYLRSGKWRNSDIVRQAA